MLPADHRMRRSDEFRQAVRRGHRSGSRMVVVHLYRGDSVSLRSAPAEPAPPARVGFVVSRGVGGSVVRSQVTRRLRHVMRSRLDSIPEGALVVVRALNPAASASSATLAADVDRALARLIAGSAA